MSERDPTNPFAPMDNSGWLQTADDGCTVCPECRGQTWRAAKAPRLGPGVYEVRCDKCNGFGWIDREDITRP